MKKFSVKSVIIFGLLCLALPFLVLLLKPTAGAGRSIISVLLFLGLSHLCGLLYLASIIILLIRIKSNLLRILAFIVAIVIGYGYFILSADSFVKLKRIHGEHITRYREIMMIGDEFREYIAEKNLDYISEDVWCNCFDSLYDESFFRKNQIFIDKSCKQYAYYFNDNIDSIAVSDLKPGTILLIEKEERIYSCPYILAYEYSGRVVRYKD